MTFIRPDYGDHQAQHRDWLERCGLLEPARDERWTPPVESIPSRAFVPATSYPLDEAA